MVFIFGLLPGCRQEKVPTCTILNPEQNAEFGKGDVIKIDVHSYDRDGRVEEVHFYVDGNGLAASAFPFSYYWDTKGFSLGEHVIKAVAYDDQANEISDSRTISIVLSSPRVETKDVESITPTSAIVGGSVTGDGGETVIETGIYWGPNENLLETGNKQRINGPPQNFSIKLVRLATNQEYFYRSYAVNNIGEGLGEVKDFRTYGNETGYFTDSRDGHAYKWVRIGDQTWMAENLAYLPKIFDPRTGSEYYKFYYVYNYSGLSIQEATQTPEYKKYGVLYNWEAALAACPIGWHLPTDDEWIELEIAQEMDPVEASNADWRGNYQGRELKSDYDWFEDGNGTNTSDFEVLPAGYRHGNNVLFNYQSKYGYFWTASEYSSVQAWMRSFYYNNHGVFRNTSDKSRGYSVRCVKD